MRTTTGIILILLLLSLSGCSLVTGGTKIFLPDEDRPIIIEEESRTDKTIIFTDGFDFPVGDADGRSWGITGYGFLQWSNVSNSWHPGEDWNIPGAGNGDWGQPVYSIANGIVLFAGWNTAQGNIVLIEHTMPNGKQVWSQYAHLDRLYVSAGEIVGRRQKIGTVGRGPNNRFAAHLHFEIKQKYLPSNGWPRTSGVPWNKEKVLEYWVNPSLFIWQNRPR